MKIITTQLAILSLFVSLSLSQGGNGPDDTLWVDLFNGTDFDGLYTYNTNTMGYDSSLGGTPMFRPNNGMIQVNSEGGDRDGHIATVKDYSYFHMKVDINIPGGNCGIMYHLREDIVQANEHARLYGKFPPSIEAQGQRGNYGDTWVIANVWMDTKRSTSSNTYDPNGNDHTIGGVTTGGRNIGASTKQYNTSTWNTVEVIAWADSFVIHQVNGNEVFQGWNIKYTPGNTTTSGQPLPPQPYAKEPFGYGKLSLQAEGARVDYRNFKVAELIGCQDSTYEEYKSYLVKHDSSYCVTKIVVPVAKSEFKDGIQGLNINSNNKFELYIYDTFGKNVFSKFGTGPFKFNNPDFTPGIYPVRAIVDGQIYRTKIYILE